VGDQRLVAVDAVQDLGWREGVLGHVHRAVGGVEASDAAIAADAGKRLLDRLGADGALGVQGGGIVCQPLPHRVAVGGWHVRLLDRRMGRVWRCLKPLAPQLLTNALMVAVLAGWKQARPGRHRGGGMVVGVDVAGDGATPRRSSQPITARAASEATPCLCQARPTASRANWTRSSSVDELLGVISDDRYQLQPTG
jgi:hypothetical protein